MRHAADIAAELREQIYEHLVEHPDTNQAELAEALNVNIRTIRRHVKRLKEDNRIEVRHRIFDISRYVTVSQEGLEQPQNPVEEKKGKREIRGLGMAWLRTKKTIRQIAPARSMIRTEYRAQRHSDCACEGIKPGDPIAEHETAWYHPDCLYDLLDDIRTMTDIFDWDKFLGLSPAQP